VAKKKRVTKKTREALWRNVLYADLIERAYALGITTFEKEKIWEIITHAFENDLLNRSIKAKYRKVIKMTPRGRTAVLNGLQEVWPGHKNPRRKNAPKLKAHPGATAEVEEPKTKKPPPPPKGKKKPPPPKTKKVESDPYIEGIMNRGPVSKDSSGPPRIIDPNCVACGGTGENSKGWQCEPCSKNGKPIPSMGEQLQEAWDEKLEELPPKPKPPPPKAKKRPPPPKAKKKPPPPKSKKKPSPPAKRLPSETTVGRTYDGEDHPKTTKAAHKHRVCFHLELDCENENKAVVVDTLNNYLVEETEFGACVQDGVRLGEGLFDVLVDYSIHITKAFALLKAHAWVVEAKAKPAADFGKIGVVATG